MTWEEDCVQLARVTEDWFWAEFSSDAYISSAAEEVPPLGDRIIWFALPADRSCIKSKDGQPGEVLNKLRKAAEWLRNAAGEIDKVVSGNFLVDWEGEAAESVKTYISSVKTSCKHLESYIEALHVAAEAHADRLYAIEQDVVTTIDQAKRQVEDGNDTTGEVATTIVDAIGGVAVGGPAGGVTAGVTSALKTGAVRVFDQNFPGDGVYATRELKDALGKLRSGLDMAMRSVANALEGLAQEISSAKIPAEVDLPRVVQEPAFDPSEFYIDDPRYDQGQVSTDPIFETDELVPKSKEAKDEKYGGVDRRSR